MYNFKVQNANRGSRYKMAVIANIKEYFNKTTPRRKFAGKDYSPPAFRDLGKLRPLQKAPKPLNLCFYVRKRKNQESNR